MDDISQLTFRLALVASGMAALAYWGTLLTGELATAPGALAVRSGGWLRPAARLGAMGAAVLLLLTLLARWRASGEPPWSNMWEFTVTFAASIAVAYVLFERFERDVTVTGGVVLGTVLALLLSALFFFPSRIEPLVPALQSRGILALHVATIAIAYGALTVSFAAALLRLVQGGRQRFARLPAPRTLERVAHSSVIVGFPLLTLGIALGAYWANSAWGRYWGWDPKETASLVTWLIYGAYLHARGLRDWRGARASMVLVGGYGAVLFTYFGVNLWISGLHSYA